jgi:hypothetical protein
MLKFIKWVAVLVLLPILVIKEIYTVLQDSGISIPEADDVLSQVKSEMKTGTDSTEDYSDKIDID